MAPAPRTSGPLTAALVAAAVSVATVLAMGQRAESQARREDRQTIAAQRAEIDRLRLVVEAQRDSIRRLEELLAHAKKD